MTPSGAASSGRAGARRRHASATSAARLREGKPVQPRRVLANAEKLQRLCGEAYASLYDSDEAALARLGGVWKRVAELAEVDPVFQPHVEARDAVKSQLEDLAAALRSYGEAIDASPAKLQETARYTAGLLMRHVVSIPEYTPHRGYSLSAYVLTADPRQERMKFIEEFAAAIKQDEG